MGEEQCAGNRDEDRKDQPGAAGGHAARLNTPFEYRQRYYEDCEKAMQQDFGISESRPETDGPEGPGLRIAAEK